MVIEVGVTGLKGANVWKGLVKDIEDAANKGEDHRSC